MSRSDAVVVAMALLTVGWRISCGEYIAAAIGILIVAALIALPPPAFNAPR